MAFPFRWEGLIATGGQRLLKLGRANGDDSMLEQALYGTRRRAFVLALLTSSALGVVEASAQVNITFTLDTTGQPVWNRPLPNTGFPPFMLSGVGTAVPYLALPVQTIGSGVVTHAWTARSTFDPDTVGYIYSPSFNAAQPLVNAIRATTTAVR